jgi:hypothetical protein
MTPTKLTAGSNSISTTVPKEQNTPTFETDRLPLAIFIDAVRALAFSHAVPIGGNRVRFVFHDPANQGRSIERDFDCGECTVNVQRLFGSQRFLRRQTVEALKNLWGDDVESETKKNNAVPHVEHSRSVILGAEDWFSLDLSTEEREPIFGTPDNVLIGRETKNLIEAPEKCFKTTFLMRLTLALSCGQTVLPELPVFKPRNVLYIHGELNKRELQARLIDAAQELPRPLNNFVQGRDLNAHFMESEGQAVIRKMVEDSKPEVLVIDPWQSFIRGHNFSNAAAVLHNCSSFTFWVKSSVSSKSVLRHVWRLGSLGGGGSLVVVCRL